MNVHSFIIRQAHERGKVRRKETPKLNPCSVFFFAFAPTRPPAGSLPPTSGLSRITLSHIISVRFHTINLPYEPISLWRKNNNKSFLLGFCLLLEIGEERIIVFVCSTKHLRKLFVVWWKCCVLEMIRGYFASEREFFV